MWRRFAPGARSVAARQPDFVREMPSSSSFSSSASIPATATSPSTSSPAPRQPPLRGVVFDMDGTLTKAGSLDFDEMYRRAGVCRSKDILTEVAAMPAAQRVAAMQAIADVEAEGAARMEMMPGVVRLVRYLDARGAPVAIVTRNSAATLRTFLREFWAPEGLRPVHPALSRDGEVVVGHVGDGEHLGNVGSSDVGSDCTSGGADDDASGSKDATAAGAAGQRPGAPPPSRAARLIPGDLPPKPHPAAMRAIAARWRCACDAGILMVGDSAQNDIAFGNRAGTRTALLVTGHSCGAPTQQPAAAQTANAAAAAAAPAGAAAGADEAESSADGVVATVHAAMTAATTTATTPPDEDHPTWSVDGLEELVQLIETYYAPPPRE